MDINELDKTKVTKRDNLIAKLESTERIAHFKLLEKIATGGMGVIYKAMDINLERDVAIKFLNLNLLEEQDPSLVGDYQKRFIREARLTAKLNHPNIVRIYDAHFDSDLCYFVMEYITGSTILEHLYQVEERSLHTACTIILPVVKALRFAHDRFHVIHRDLKPDNIMFDEFDQIKVLDLGIARIFDEDQSLTVLTTPGTMLGTPYYMAPEQAMGKSRLDHRVDIFSLGIILYILLTDNRPFSGNTDKEIFTAKVQNKIDPIPDNLQLPDEVVNLITNMLKPLPEKRCNSYAEIEDILSRMLQKGPSQTPVKSNEPVMEQVHDQPTSEKGVSLGGTLGNYKILELIGRGGMGIVYRGVDADTGKEYAVKVLNKSSSDSSENDIEQFRNEAEILRKLNHNAIVKIAEIGHGNGVNYIIMELFLGPENKPLNLLDYASMHDGLLDPDNLQSIMIYLLDAIEYAHDHNIIHCDIKPANVLFSYKGSTGADGGTEFWRVDLKLTDFGLAKIVGEECMKESILLAVQSVKQHGDTKDEVAALVGTYAYMSPELRRGEPATVQSDLYAVGKIIYQLLTGKQDLGLKRPSQLRPELNENWNDFILKALASKPEDRFSSAKEMISVLESL